MTVSITREIAKKPMSKYSLNFDSNQIKVDRLVFQDGSTYKYVEFHEVINPRFPNNHTFRTGVVEDNENSIPK